MCVYVCVCVLPIVKIQRAKKINNRNAPLTLSMLRSPNIDRPCAIACAPGARLRGTNGTAEPRDSGGAAACDQTGRGCGLREQV